MVGLIVLHLLAAVGTFVLVSTGIYVAQSQLCLQTPMARQYPLIAVAHTDSCHPAFITVVLQRAEVCAEKLEIGIHIAYIVYTAHQMSPEKMSVETLAEPGNGVRAGQP